MQHCGNATNGLGRSGLAMTADSWRGAGSQTTGTARGSSRTRIRLRVGTFVHDVFGSKSSRKTDRSAIGSSSECLSNFPGSTMDF